MISAKHFAGSRATLRDGYSRRQKNKVKNVGTGGRKILGSNLVLDHFLNRRIVDRFGYVGIAKRVGANSLAVRDFILRHAVFRQLIDQRTGQNIVKKSINSWVIAASG